MSLAHAPAAKSKPKEEIPAAALHRKPECGADERTSAVGMPRFLVGAQTRLVVGAPDDPLEHEADRVAGHVMRMPEPGSAAPTLSASPTGRAVQRRCETCSAPLVTQAPASPYRIQRKCAACQAAERTEPCDECEKVQRRADWPAGSPARAGRAAAADSAALIRGATASGEPLPRPMRDFFEPRFGHDFGAVRVHTGTSAADSARDFGARAYTVGEDIVFGAGRYAPDSMAGRELLAHELTHTIQQTGGRPLASDAMSGPALPVSAASAPATISRAREARVQRGMLEELGLDDVCISDICVDDVAYSIGDLGIGGVTIGDITSPVEDVAVDVVDATGVDLTFVGDVLGLPADIATAGLDALGVHLSLDGTEITARVDDIELGSLDVPIDLPEFGGVLPLLALPLPPGIVAYVGVRLGLKPKIVLTLGPIGLRDIHIRADPLGPSVGGGAELSIAGAITGIAVLRGAVEGGIAIPELASSLSLEGGLRYTGIGVAKGSITERIELDLNALDVLGALAGGSLPRNLIAFDSDTALASSVGLKVWLNAYAAARVDDKIICEYIWPGAFWEAGREWGLDLPLSASLGTDGISIEADEASATYRDIPFEEIGGKLGEEPPLGLNCLGFEDLLGEYDYEEPTEGIRVCSRPLAFPIWTGLPAARHAFIYDPLTEANYAIREPLVWGNGVTTSCSPKTSSSAAPDDVATSRCKPCSPRPGPPETERERQLEVSKCLQRTYNAYPGPNLYRNGPDRAEGNAWGPNSNSFGAAMAACCHEFDRTGLGILPGWNHGPATPCPPRTLDETVAWIIGLETPEGRVFELARLGAMERRSIVADDKQVADLQESIGVNLWPTAQRILNGSASADVPSLSESTAYEADAYIHQRVPERASRHARVDALRVVVVELEGRRVLDPRLATWSYVAGAGSGDAMTSWFWQTDATTGERRAEGAADIEVFDPAFADVGWLFSTVMHEWTHVVTVNAGVPAAAFDVQGQLTPQARARNEVEAYLWEIEHAAGTGVLGNADQLSELGRRLTTHYNAMSREDKAAYADRYRAARRRVQRAAAGLPAMSVEEARRIVQETSAAIERALARRPGHEQEVDAEIERLRRRRDAALIEVALTDNPAIQVVRPGASGDYRVPTIDDAGRLRSTHGGILVAWHLGPVPPTAFGLGAQLGSDPHLQGGPMAIAGTAVQGRVHPYPPDVDFDEHLDIRATSAWNAGKVVTDAIIGFVNRNEGQGNVEFTNMAVFPGRGRNSYFSRETVLLARDGDQGAFGSIAGAISRLGDGNLNTYWRGWIRDDATRPPRFVEVTKVMTIHAENPRTREVYIDSEHFPDINLAFLDEPGTIPRGNLGEFAMVMCCQAVTRWIKKDFLKAAKRAYNYFTVVGDLTNMARLEPIFRTPQARASQDLAALSAIHTALATGRYVATRILQIEDARTQVRTAADGIETLPDARRGGVGTPTQSPGEIAEQLRDLTARLQGTLTGLLAQDDELAKDLNLLIKAAKQHIDLSLDAPATDTTGEGVITSVIGRLDRDVCPADKCPS